MNNGWVCFHRKIWQHVRRPFADSTIAWMWMFSFAEFSGEDRGSVFASYDDLAAAWGWDKARVISQIQRWETEQPEPKLLKSRRPEFGQSSATVSATVSASISARGPARIVWRFSIVKYDDYQISACDLGQYFGQGDGQGFNRVLIQDTARVRPGFPDFDTQMGGSNSGQSHPTQSNPNRTIEQYKNKNAASKKAAVEKPKNPTRGQQAKELLDYFHDRHHEIRREKYHVIGKRDMPALKRILNTLPDIEEIKRRIDVYLNDPQRWAGEGYSWTITGFEKKFSAYAPKSGGSGKRSLEVLREMKE